MTAYLQPILVNLWITLGDMAPYLLFGFFVAGLLSVLVSPATVERHLGGRGLLPVIKAAAVGVPLPLCSCGVIPVSASLRQHGASRGATVAFLISTPQTGVDSIAVTLSLMGPVMAVFRPLAALVSGILGGWLVDLVDGHDPSGPGREAGAARAQDPDAAGESGAGCVARLWQALRYGFLELPRDIARPILGGLVIAALIATFAPPIRQTLGSGWAGMLLMMAVGIPMYVCATASVPIAAALVAKGVSPGAALVFLMTGPATNAATLATIWRVMGRRTALMYLAVIAGTALAAGFLLDAMIGSAFAATSHAAHEMLPDWVRVACSVALLAVMAGALWPRRRTAHEAFDAAPGGTVVTLEIRGMTCEHCEANVSRALGACQGVRAVEVDRRRGLARIKGDALQLDRLVQASEDAGYPAAGKAPVEPPSRP